MKHIKPFFAAYFYDPYEWTRLIWQQHQPVSAEGRQKDAWKKLSASQQSFCLRRGPHLRNNLLGAGSDDTTGFIDSAWQAGAQRTSA
jgi:hypothetical protein